MKENKKNILIIDSGNGGRFVLDTFKNALPNENYILFMDSKNCPYGNKSYEELKKIVVTNLKILFTTYEIKLVVVGCNTLSSLFENFLRETFNDVIFFFVTPFVPKRIQNKSTLILATNNTIKYNAKIQYIIKNDLCLIAGFDDLALKIDKNLQNTKALMPYLKTKLQNFTKSKNIKNIVLGCTHFNFIKEQLDVLFPNVIFFEGTTNTLTEVKSFLVKNNLENKNLNSIGKTLILNSL